MDKNTAELLQELIDIKKNTRSAIEDKGVAIVGGMKTYPSAVSEISQVFAGTEIDFTRAGWLQSESDEYNREDAEFMEKSLQYSNLAWRTYGDYKNWERQIANNGGFERRRPVWRDDMIIAPKIINYEIDYPCYMGSPFSGCTSLRYIPPFDTSRTTDFSGFFDYCKSLIKIPQIDTSAGIDFSSMARYCESISEFPQLDTHNAEDVNHMFAYSPLLRSIPKLDFSNVKNANYIIQGCHELEYLGGFENLKAYIDLKNTSDYPSKKTKLTVESIMNVFNNLYDWNENPEGLNKDDYYVDGETPVAGQISIPYAVGEQLTEEQIAVATDKGWDVRW